MQKGITIRPLRAKDYLGVKKLLANEGKGKELTLKKFSRLIKNTHQAHCVATHQAKIVGVQLAISDGADVGYLYKMQVDSGFRRMGIATKLVSYVLKKWKKYHLRLIFGRVHLHNTASKKTMEKNGFRMLEPEYRLMDYGI